MVGNFRHHLARSICYDVTAGITQSKIFSVFPECAARVPVSLGGLGVRLCSPKVAFAAQPFATRQPSATFATVCVTAVRLSTVASAPRGGLKSVSSSLVASQFYVCESDLRRRSFIGVCRGGVCESDLRRRSYIGVCRGGVSVSDL